MSVLSRANLADGSYRSGLGMPDHLTWTDQQIEASFQAAWAERPPGAIWVFGYGSLIWNPLISFEETSNATLGGWRRSFCLSTISGRGSAAVPGRLLSLQRGGRVDGVAFRLPSDRLGEELRLLWMREMISGNYEPAWVSLELADGRRESGIAFTAFTGSAQHEPDDSPATVAPVIVRAIGVFGPNLDYLVNLREAMQRNGLKDAYLDEVDAAIRSLPGRAPRADLP